MERISSLAASASANPSGLVNSPFSSTPALVNETDSLWNHSRSLSELTDWRPRRSPSARTLTGSLYWAMSSARPVSSNSLR